MMWQQNWMEKQEPGQQRRTGSSCYQWHSWQYLWLCKRPVANTYSMRCPRHSSCFLLKHHQCTLKEFSSNKRSQRLNCVSADFHFMIHHHVLSFPFHFYFSPDFSITYNFNSFFHLSALYVLLLAVTAYKLALIMAALNSHLNYLITCIIVMQIWLSHSLIPAFIICKHAHMQAVTLTHMTSHSSQRHFESKPYKVIDFNSERRHVGWKAVCAVLQVKAFIYRFRLESNTMHPLSSRWIINSHVLSVPHLWSIQTLKACSFSMSIGYRSHVPLKNCLCRTSLPITTCWQPFVNSSSLRLDSARSRLITSKQESVNWN